MKLAQWTDYVDLLCQVLYWWIWRMRPLANSCAGLNYYSLLTTLRHPVLFNANSAMLEYRPPHGRGRVCRQLWDRVDGTNTFLNVLHVFIFSITVERPSSSASYCDLLVLACCQLASDGVQLASHHYVTQVLALLSVNCAPLNVSRHSVG